MAPEQRSHKYWIRAGAALLILLNIRFTRSSEHRQVKTNSPVAIADDQTQQTQPPTQQQTQPPPQTPPQQPQIIQRIYYINLDKNIKRRQSMEDQLSQQSIPWERVPASLGETNSTACIPRNRIPEGNCKGVSGLAKSNLNILKNYNTTGITLVLEDDVRIHRLQSLQEMAHQTLQKVPDNWDIIRFDCNEDVLPLMNYFDNENEV